jgi:hypothetical protein
MSQTINRMYDSPERANLAAEALRTNRFDRFDEVHVVGRHSEDAAGAADGEASVDAIVAALMKAYVLKAHAKVFAEGIRRGGTLVTVHAHFGTAAAAMGILDRHGPIDSGLPDATYPMMPWDEAAPCSSLLHAPVLLPDSATFSRFWNVPALLKKGATTFSALGIPETTRSSVPFTGTFGMQMISNKPTILSSMLGMPVLSKPPAARAARRR